MNKIIQRVESAFLSLISKLEKTNYKELAIRTAKSPIFWVRFAAYAIPLAFLLYVLYMNFLPFGYNKTFIIDVGSPTDTNGGEFYLEPSQDLSERKVAADGTTYRELNGSAYAVFKPNAVLKDATVTVSVEGLSRQSGATADDGVSLIPPVIDIDPATINWDYSWDFTKTIPADLKGNSFVFDGAATFNGRDTRLELPNSADMFEDGPFTIYAEWTPNYNQKDMQQIVGHFNWELWQNKESVELRVGRVNNAQGQTYSLKYPITSDFFNIRHSAVAFYNPSDNGYMDLYIDNNFAGRTYLGSNKIWNDYNGKQNITIGKSNHGASNYFNGVIFKINLVNKITLSDQIETIFNVNNSEITYINIVSTKTSILNKITCFIKK